uniref:Uncharacterized protein n=1 Tax=Anguilla anguilla TaxID=7936 RepID=A0A0E9TP10_ANGAN
MLPLASSVHSCPRLSPFPLTLEVGPLQEPSVISEYSEFRLEMEPSISSQPIFFNIGLWAEFPNSQNSH